MSREITLAEFNQIVRHNYFLHDNCEYKCVDTKTLTTGALVLFTKTKTFVIFQSDIWRFTVESMEEREMRLQKQNPKYQYGLENALSNIVYEHGEVPKTNLKYIKRMKPKVVEHVDNIVRIPLSQPVKEYLREKYKNMPTSLLERSWSEEETDVVFRASTREMSILINRNINTINRMKKLILEKSEHGGVLKETANIITKPLSDLQVTHFTQKYRTNDGFRTGEWSDEELRLLFRGKPSLISKIINRSKVHVHAKRKEIMDNLKFTENNSIISDESVKADMELETELEKVS